MRVPPPLLWASRRGLLAQLSPFLHAGDVTAIASGLLFASSLGVAVAGPDVGWGALGRGGAKPEGVVAKEGPGVSGTYGYSRRIRVSRERRLQEPCPADAATVLPEGGALPLLPRCERCVLPDVDVCVYAMSSCMDLAAGLSCQFSCRPPYSGRATFGNCPSSNSNRSQHVVGELPNCSYTFCPDPPIVPEGFIQQWDGSWMCAPGFTGQVSRVCGTDASCGLMYAEFSGCTPLSGCAAPAIDPALECVVDASSCAVLPPGGTCSLRCKYPYLGDSTSGICSDRNTDPLVPPVVTLPQCDMDCPDPETLPVGYEYTRDRQIICAGGFLGEPLKACSVNATCGLEVAFSGCIASYGCLAPAIPAGRECEFNIQECYGLFPGGSCSILCQDPYIGVATAGSCPPGNTDPVQRVVGDLPNCTLTCPDPVGLLPDGYQMESDLYSSWYICAAAYTGTAQKICAIDENCVSMSAFVGCLPMETCVLPAIADGACRFDFSECTFLLGGQSCLVRCSLPFSGGVGYAWCPAGNLDSTTSLEYELPECYTECDPFPAGYMKLESGWSCAPGYGGTVVELFQTCGQPRLTGCSPLAPCGPLMVDDCSVNVTDCSDNVLPGDTCVLSCTTDYFGESTIAHCPHDNTDFSGMVQYVMPNCTYVCPDPIPMPFGYERTEYGVLQCDNATHRGNASEFCLSSPAPEQNCSTVYQNFTGCSPLANCTPLDDDLLAFNMEDSCEAVVPDSLCTVSCVDPYVGEDVEGICPADNVDMFHPVLLPHGLPECSLKCDTVPPGYRRTKTGWECMEGFAGTPVITCINGPSWCAIQMKMEGCNLVVPCAPLGLDRCAYDVSACAAVEAGGICQVPCVAPFTGPVGNFSCPVENIDPFQQPIGEASCRTDACPEPELPLPHGYAGNGTWVCDQTLDFTGTPRKVCVGVGEECILTGVLEGCLPRRGCAPLELDPCVYNSTNCTALLPGEGCEISCMPGFSGGQTTAVCPMDNDDPATLPQWTMELMCTPLCPVPEPFPVGYRVSPDERWRCAPGYIGLATAVCTLDLTTCERVLHVSGCFFEAPCVSVVNASMAGCAVDVSNCTNVPAGERCEVVCKPGYTGIPGVAECPAGNLDFSTEAMYIVGHSEPDCNFTYCPDPPVVEERFAKVNGEWGCGPSYVGDFFSNCSISAECDAELQLFGCVPMMPCLSVVSPDPCRYNVSSCGQLNPGETCTITCADPYDVNVFDGAVTCPTTSPDVMQAVEFDLPTCELVCPLPDELPDGYLGHWPNYQCDEGYLTMPGDIYFNCTINEVCGLEYNFTGCEKLLPCVPLVIEDTCQFDASECGSVPAGGSCSIYCAGPYIGNETVAMCPHDNIDPAGSLHWVLPECIPLCTSADVEFAPPGNILANLSMEGVNETIYYQEWQCEEGYVGSVIYEDGPLQPPTPYFVPNITCVVTPDCRAEVQATGCKQLVPCAEIVPPNPCMWKMPGCNPLMGGGNCAIFCNSSGYADPEKMFVNATCPYYNTDPALLPRFDDINCQPACRLTPPYPDGYTKAQAATATPSPSGETQAEENLPWVCAEGYFGEAHVECVVDMDSCESYLAVSGCLPLVDCAPPDYRVIDGCMFDMDDCAGSSLSPGGDCTVKCVPPYDGDPVTAKCPQNNVNPLYPVQVDHMPYCSLVCPAPEPMPEGYIDIIDADNVTHFFCDEPLYFGEAHVECRMATQWTSLSNKPNCFIDITLSGCDATVPCVEPPGMSDNCEFDVSNCEGTMAAGRCVVECRFPFKGTPSLGLCPPGNMNPFKVVEVVMPDCELECQELDPMPDGYTGNVTKWECAEGYYGDAIPECEMTDAPLWMQALGVPKCMLITEFHGCNLMQPCLPLEFITACVYAPDCEEVQEGGSCSTSCLEPCTGDPMTLTCPKNNIDPMQPLLGTRPVCEVLCDPVVDGYEKGLDGLWRCSDGYIGAPSIACGSSTWCKQELKVQGCVELLPCDLPEYLLALHNSCEIDASDCLPSLAGNSTCEIRCKAPYSGEATIASCPDLNTDRGNMRATLPCCSLLSCEDPEEDDLPGYLKSDTPARVPPERCPQNFGEGELNEDGTRNDTYAGDGWTCAPFYFGEVTRKCVVNATCGAVADVSGCHPVRTCVLPDNCLADYEACNASLDSSIPAGEICNVTCKAPYFDISHASTVGGYCPDLNSDFNQVLIHPDPVCGLVCPDPEEMPEGYVKHACSPELFAVTTDSPHQPTGTPRRRLMLLEHEHQQLLVECNDTEFFNGSEIVNNNCTNLSYEPLEHTSFFEEVNVTNFSNETPPLDCSTFDPANPYSCAPGYAGMAVPICTNDTSCIPGLQFSGCSKRRRCAPLEEPPPNLTLDARFAGCSVYDVSDCASLRPGQSCEIRCKGPEFAGTTTRATCDPDNSDVFRQPDWEFLPDCHVGCEEQMQGIIDREGGVVIGNRTISISDIFVGYTRINWGDWQCDEDNNYVGEAELKCNFFNGDDWMEEGWRSDEDNCTFRAYLDGCKPLTPCVEPDPRTWDTCIYDISGCSLEESRLPGAICYIGCTPPYEGYPVAAYCPADNVDPTQLPIYSEPNCVLQCPNPEPMPPGYNLDNISACSTGYTGVGNKTCWYESKYSSAVDAKVCHWTSQLSGCVKLEKCSAPIPTECGVNTSDCSNISAGEVCYITCLPGFIMDAGSLEGPTPTTTTTTPILPVMLARGRTKVVEGRQIWSSLKTTADFEISFNLTVWSDFIENFTEHWHWQYDSGILRFTVTNRDRGAFGDQMPVFRWFPRGLHIVMGRTYGSNDAEHDKYCRTRTDLLELGVDYRIVARLYLDLFQVWLNDELICSIDGYYWTKYPGMDNVQVWLSDQFASAADAWVTDLLYTPLIEPEEVDNESIPEPPQVAITAVSAICPYENTVYGTVVDHVMPICRFDFICPIPDIMPLGYQYWPEDDVFNCTEGYVGTALMTCVLQSDCSRAPVLTGCALLKTCLSPIAPACSGVDPLSCTGTPGGEPCFLTCAPGFEGNATSASCPLGNTDAYGLEWSELPACTFVYCPDPGLPGYVQRDTGEWVCADDYDGTVIAFCDECTAQWLLSGCVGPTSACKELDFYSTCTYEIVAPTPDMGPNLEQNCSSVPAGHSCVMACMAPYYAPKPGAEPFSLVSCPSDNQLRNLEPSYTLPECELVCVIPDLIPTGYLWNNVSWECAEGYTGQAMATCTINETSCEITTELHGCSLVQPCITPIVEHCTYNLSECGPQLEAGQSCEVHCVHPSQGNPVLATCFENNTELGGFFWEEPRCAFRNCPDDVPVGYQKLLDGWHCAPGYEGVVEVNCSSGTNCCDAGLLLTGCVPLEACLALQVDTCMYELVGCGDVFPGHTCEVQCKVPTYSGSPAIAECQRSAAPLQVELPTCTPVCPTPYPLPAGYNPRPDLALGWECATGYAGAPLVSCTVDHLCQTHLSLDGCLRSENCIGPDMEDPCPYDVSDCADVAPGSSCLVRCAQPFVGTPAWALCPADNMQPGRPVLNNTLPQCVLECPDPSLAPVGYQQSDSGDWECAEGYTGVVVMSCTVAGDCVITTLLSGCLPLVPCVQPTTDNCEFDVSDCDGPLPAGEHCFLRCRTPFSGSTRVITCPPLNTDPTAEAIWPSAPPPRCSCGEPASAPAGYAKTLAGWLCEPGMVGFPTKVCKDSQGQCLEAPLLSGCKVATVCEAYPFVDEDDRPSIVRGTLVFGPARHDDGAVNETGVYGYEAYFADSCGQLLGDSLGVIYTPPSNLIESSCCRADLYPILVYAEMPDGATQMVVMAFTQTGLAPEGLAVPFSDTGATTTPVPGTGSASRVRSTVLLRFIIPMTVVTACLREWLRHSQ